MRVLAVYARNPEGEKVVGNTVRCFRFSYPNYKTLLLLRLASEGNIDIKMLEVEETVEFTQTPILSLVDKSIEG